MTAKRAKQVRPRTQYRFGIGEWYGVPFTSLTPEKRRSYAAIQLQEETKPKILCPFLSKPGKEKPCWKPGGICSLRSYEKSPETGIVQPDQRGSTFRTTCPSRFEQDDTVYSWIADVLLGTRTARAIGEIPFLQRVPRIDQGEAQIQREVGRIDKVLAIAGPTELNWCPVEKQAVYFSGKKMAHDFKHIAESAQNELPFPLHNRRPDYRSSGPKRLLPQLQVKVPTLRNWGKKMAVVVDEDFFNELGSINTANDLSNAEVVWFVVRYVEKAGEVRLEPKSAFMTTLDDSVKALVAAIPLPRSKFEEIIRAKLSQPAS